MNFTVDGDINTGFGTNEVPSPELKKVFKDEDLRLIDFKSYKFLNDANGNINGIEISVYDPGKIVRIIEHNRTGADIAFVEGKVQIKIKTAEVVEKLKESKEVQNVLNIEEKKDETPANGEHLLSEEEISNLGKAKIIEVKSNKPFQLEDGTYQFMFKIPLKYVLIMHKDKSRTYVKQDGEIVSIVNATKVSPVKK